MTNEKRDFPAEIALRRQRLNQLVIAKYTPKNQIDYGATVKSICDLQNQYIAELEAQTATLTRQRDGARTLMARCWSLLKHGLYPAGMGLERDQLLDDLGRWNVDDVGL